MKTSVKAAFGLSLVWIIINLIFFLSGNSREAFGVGILLNLFCLLCAIALALFLTKKEKGFAPNFFLDDLKVALQGGIVYALTISTFLYVYHEYIDSSIKDALIENQMTALHKAYPDKESYMALQESDVQWKNKTFDDFIENQEDQFASIYTSFSVFAFHLAGLFIFSMFFSFFATIIIRKVILRQ